MRTPRAKNTVIPAQAGIHGSDTAARSCEPGFDIARRWRFAGFRFWTGRPAAVLPFCGWTRSPSPG